MINSKPKGFLFDEVKLSSPQKSAFDLSFENKMSSNLGDLTVTLCKECLPGDYLELQTSNIVRFAPTLAPILHKVDVMTYTFFVPNRLIWNNWEKFITAGNGDVPMAQQASFVPPVSPYFTPEDLITAYGNSGPQGQSKYIPNIQGTLADYLGVPNIAYEDSGTDSYSSKRFSLLPFLAYQLVWSEWFRDQNLEENPFENGTFFKNDGRLAGISTSSTSAIEELFTLRKKAWEKDYFTSALPTPQRGPSVALPLGASATLEAVPAGSSIGPGHGTASSQLAVATNNDMLQYTQSGQQRFHLEVGGLSLPSSPSETPEVDGNTNYNNLVYSTSQSGAYGKMGITTPLSAGQDVAHYFAAMPRVEITDNFKVDLSAASSATVETLRNAFKLQEFLEIFARLGSRYSELIRGIFDVVPDDARMQRPELLGTNREPVVVSPIEQQSASDNEPSPTGTLYGKLTSTSKQDTIKYNVKEHGFLIQLQCVLPRTSYQQGFSRMYTHRETYLDYAWPQFAHLGEQEVYNSELWNGYEAPLAGESPAYVKRSKAEEVFGYQPRYVEWKYNNDEVHGDFRSNLRFWHMSRIFTTQPTLSAAFIHADPRLDVFAVTSPTVHHLYEEIWHDFKCIRSLPEYGTPHF